MPLGLLSKPVGASGTGVAAETRAKVTATAAMKSFMGSASSSGLRVGLEVNITLRRESQSLKRSEAVEIGKVPGGRTGGFRTFERFAAAGENEATKTEGATRG